METNGGISRPAEKALQKAIAFEKGLENKRKKRQELSGPDKHTLAKAIESWMAEPDRVRFPSWKHITTAFSTRCGFAVNESNVRYALTQVRASVEDVLDKSPSSVAVTDELCRRVAWLEAVVVKLVARIEDIENFGGTQSPS
jgi:hypothetical protein